MFIQGLKHGLYTFIATVAAIMIAMQFKNDDITKLIIGITVIVSWLLVGFFFKKNYGSLLSIATDAKRIKGIWYYILGVGLLWGPAKLFITDYPIPESSLLINIALALVSVPLAGASVIGALLIGGIFYRGNTAASNKAFKPTPKSGAV